MKFALSDKQLDLLKQIATEKTYLTAAAHSGVLWALQTRDLIKTGYTGGRSSAVVTAGGSFYLQHGKHPKEVQAEKERLQNDPAQAAQAPVDGVELLARLREAGGTLTVPDPGPRTRGCWRSAYYHALHQGHVPDSFKLRMTGRDKGDVILRLIDEAARKAAEPAPVPVIDVPESLPARPHPLVARTRTALGRSKNVADTRGRPDMVPIRVSRHLADRALRIAHAVICEAERRGYEVAADSDIQRGEATHQLIIRI
ncbi:hypothetical protein ABZ070_34640 [Streptomyces sp. NPDC006283]|uniref:hypothetical protein n=1 Tax=Streptomyces sp. NPDC006283 TaxID=3156741 RepID=UPI0033AA2F19